MIKITEIRSPKALLFDGNTRNEDGFTLIEVVITIVLVSVLAGVAAMLMLQSIKSYAIEQSRSDVHYQVRFAIERMEREIRLIRSRTAADISIMNPGDISFTDIQNNKVRFQLSAGTIRRSQDNGATWLTLATGVTALTFSYLQQDGVSSATATTLWFIGIDVIAQEGSETLEMRTRVYPMNF